MLREERRLSQPLKNCGFTIIETMVTVAVLGILIAVAIPSFRVTIENGHLRGVSENLYNDLKYAHTEAISRRSTMYVSFSASPNWCYGIADGGACDCSVAGSCLVSGVETVVDEISYPNFTQTLAGFGGAADLQFEGLRGIADNSGSVTFAMNGRSMTVAVNKMGRLRVCSSDLPGYKPC